MSTGTYSIEALIESEDQHEMFGLGKIEIENNLILPTTIHVNSFDSPILLILTPIATVLSVLFLMRRWKKQSQETAEEEIDAEQIPKLLGGILSMQQNSEKIEQNQESNIPETDNIECKNAYIC
jgi:hypothetical protein